MFKALLRIRLEGLLAGFSLRRGALEGKKKKSPIGYLFLLLYAFVADGFLFYMIFRQLAAAYFPAGLGWLYFAMFAIMAFALMFIGSVFTAKASLFEATDNALLLSMPVRPGLILLSRMAALLILNVIYEATVAIPVFVAWVCSTAVGVAELLSFFLIVLLLPLFSLAVSCLFAWLLSLITSRMQKTTILTTVVSVGFMLLYLLFCARMNTYITQLAENGQQLAGALRVVLPLYWLGQAAADGAGLFLLLTLAWTLVPFVLTCALLSHSFLRIVTTKRGQAKLRYAKKPLHGRSAEKALLSRELARLTNSSAYMLNAGLGLIFELIAAVLLLIRCNEITALLAQLELSADSLSPFAMLVLFFLTGTVFFTSCSVSMEGKTFWIIRSLPVQTGKILRTKLRLANTLCLPPAIVLTVVLAVVLYLPASQTLLLLACQGLFILVVSNIGLIEDLRHCNLHWSNEAQVVKQGLGTLFAMLLTWGFVLALGAVWLLLLAPVMEASAFLCAVFGTLTAIYVLSRRWLDTCGTAYFERLN